jgi:hypothetical protein
VLDPRVVLGFGGAIGVQEWLGEERWTQVLHLRIWEVGRHDVLRLLCFESAILIDRCRDVRQAVRPVVSPVDV